MRPEPVRQNQVTLRVIQPVEDPEPPKALRPINPVVPLKEMELWGIPEDPKRYEIQARLAHGLFGVTPTTLNNWEKEFLLETTPNLYVRDEAKRYRLAGVIELFVIQFRVSEHIVARVEDWDIALANGLVEGEPPEEHPRCILRNASNRAILIPNRHPDEIVGWDDEQIAKVKLNPYKCGVEQHLRDLNDRWERYQSEKAATALALSGDSESVAPPSSAIALYQTPVSNPDEEVACEIAEFVESLAVWEEYQTDDPSELDAEIQRNFKKGYAEGVKIGSARYKGRAAGISDVNEMANQKKAES